MWRQSRQRAIDTPVTDCRCIFGVSGESSSSSGRAGSTGNNKMGSKRNGKYYDTYYTKDKNRLDGNNDATATGSRMASSRRNSELQLLSNGRLWLVTEEDKVTSAAFLLDHLGHIFRIRRILIADVDCRGGQTRRRRRRMVPKATRKTTIRRDPLIDLHRRLPRWPASRGVRSRSMRATDIYFNVGYQRHASPPSGERST